MGEIEKMTLESESLIDDRLNKLKELMPEVFSESGIDFDKLRLELGRRGRRRPGALCVHVARQGRCHPPVADVQHCYFASPYREKAAAAMERMGPSTRTTFISKATISRC